MEYTADDREAVVRSRRRERLLAVTRGRFGKFPDTTEADIQELVDSRFEGWKRRRWHRKTLAGLKAVWDQLRAEHPDIVNAVEEKRRTRQKQREQLAAWGQATYHNPYAGIEARARITSLAEDSAEIIFLENAGSGKYAVLTGQSRSVSLTYLRPLPTIGQTVVLYRKVMCGTIHAVCRVVDEVDTRVCKIRVTKLLGDHDLVEGCYPYLEVGYECLYSMALLSAAPTT